MADARQPDPALVPGALLAGKYRVERGELYEVRGAFP
jgi:hypothetical protein